jgi:eukaryotic-like serine/threonine-protein kinase
LIGRTVSHYRILSPLGSGGMGVVYLAEDARLGRQVALKFLPASWSQESKALERFRIEARAASSLSHPAICAIYDIGQDGDTPFIVMEALKGETLRDRILKGPLKVADVLDIGIQLADALEAAHTQGIVHRDIKPANIHLGRLGLQYDFVKVLDFGLVKRQVEADVTFTQATGLGVVAGTPAYMAPETALGGDVDGRADLYALGCVAYYLLTGTLVFEGQGLQQIVKRLHDDPVPPSARTEVPIPVELDALVMALLAREPGARPASATELRGRLDALPMPRWTDEQAADWWQLHDRDAASRAGYEGV